MSDENMWTRVNTFIDTEARRLVTGGDIGDLVGRISDFADSTDSPVIALVGAVGILLRRYSGMVAAFHATPAEALAYLDQMALFAETEEVMGSIELEDDARNPDDGRE